jgi:uncharacterized membrane protein
MAGIFTMAVDYEEIAQNPCKKIEALAENNQRTRHLSFEEEGRLFVQLKGDREHLRTLVTLAIYSSSHYNNSRASQRHTTMPLR